MMNQETFVKLEDLRRQGWTIKEIAAETGYHPATISKWLKGGAPPGSNLQNRRTSPSRSKASFSYGLRFPLFA